MKQVQCKAINYTGPVSSGVKVNYWKTCELLAINYSLMINIQLSQTKIVKKTSNAPGDMLLTILGLK